MPLKLRNITYLLNLKIIKVKTNSFAFCFRSCGKSVCAVWCMIKIIVKSCHPISSRNGNTLLMDIKNKCTGQLLNVYTAPGQLWATCGQEDYCDKCRNKFIRIRAMSISAKVNFSMKKNVFYMMWKKRENYFYSGVASYQSR